MSVALSHFEIIDFSLQVPDLHEEPTSCVSDECRSCALRDLPRPLVPVRRMGWRGDWRKNNTPQHSFARIRVTSPALSTARGR
jgi:hypothetical protein